LELEDRKKNVFFLEFLGLFLDKTVSRNPKGKARRANIIKDFNVLFI
jgi:hypothetical protein